MPKISSRILKPAALALLHRGVDIIEVQQNLQLPENLTDTNHEISQGQALRFLEYYLSCFDDLETSASIAFIEHLNLSIFGPVGFAMMSAPTVSDTLTALVRFRHVIAIDLLADFSADIGQDQIILRWGLGEYSKPLQDFIMEISVGFLDLVRMQLPVEQWSAILTLLQLAHRPKADFVAWLQLHIPGVPVEYNQVENLLVCKPKIMRLEPLAGNDATFTLLCQQLEELNQQNLLKNRGTVDQLKKLLQKNAEKSVFLNLQQAAQSMHMSSRTLTRKLEKQASSFQMVINVVRAELACKLLRANTLPVKIIAHRSGFSSEAGFSRAFKNWFKVSPTAYRDDKNLALVNLQLTKSVK